MHDSVPRITLPFALTIPTEKKAHELSVASVRQGAAKILQYEPPPTARSGFTLDSPPCQRRRNVLGAHAAVADHSAADAQVGFRLHAVEHRVGASACQAGAAGFCLGLSASLSCRPGCLRLAAFSPTRSTRRPASASTSRKIPAGYFAVIRS